MAKKEYKINENIVLKLEEGETNIYVDGELFMLCKHLFLVNLQRNKSLQDIEAIDDAIEYYNTSLEKEVSPTELGISPEEIFWGHCSNLQAWVESGYDIRLLDSRMAFPLLYDLRKLGDRQANKVLKDGIAKKMESGNPNVIAFLIIEGYLNLLNDEEFNAVLKNPDFIEKIIEAGDYNNYHSIHNYDFPSLNLILNRLRMSDNEDFTQLIKNLLKKDLKRLNGFLDEERWIDEIDIMNLFSVILVKDEICLAQELYEIFRQYSTFKPQITIHPKFKDGDIHIVNKHIIKVNFDNIINKNFIPNELKERIKTDKNLERILFQNY